MSEHHRTCWDCGGVSSSAFPTREVHVDLPSGGYDRMRVPLCRRCRGARFGHECPNCGLHHDSHEDAAACCQRGPGDAPDCRECGRRMERGAWGVTAGGERTCEWAECEGCAIGWGRFTGWHDLDGDEELVTDGGLEAPPRAALPSECEWCSAPFPEASPNVIHRYHPSEAGHYETDVVCEQCQTYGPPGGSRRGRVEAAWTIEPQMSRLERLGWKLIHYARR